MSAHSDPPRRRTLSLEGTVAREGLLRRHDASRRRTRERREDGGSPTPLALRIAVLAVVMVFLQTGIVSELSLFGVRVDLSPLVVVFVGFLCGSTVGAVTGFGIGLLVDLTLVQTLGLTSLIFTIIGYWSGRLRELRDPQATLMPLALGALAAFTSLAGYAVIEFLLGVDAPVSAELLREILLGTIVDTIVAAPVWALVRRVLQGSVGESPRRRARRAYTTGGLSPLPRR
ncbi:MAG: rod shape-determining protein MreD [Acidobacteriota bacterium]|nr:rod shape-determining protein MreD [Acidobacteriota bacterium]